MATNNKDYWRNRAYKQLSANELDAAKALKRMNDIYLEVEEQIRKETMAIYGRFGIENGLKPNQVASYLNQSEYKVWRKTVKSYMDEIEALGIDSPKGRALWLEVEVLSAKSRVNRLEALRTAVMANMAKVAATEATEVQGHLVETFTGDYYENVYDMYKSGAPAILEDMENNAIALQSADVLNIVNQPWSGADFSSRIWANEYLIAQRLTSITTQALLAGKAPARIAKDISHEMGVSKSNAMRLILTETARVKTEADIKSYEAADVEKVKFVATLDSHTCHDGCGKKDGKIYVLSKLKPGVNKPPLHPRCRCVLLPYSEWLEEAHNKYGDRIARDKEGNNISVRPDMTYNDWYREYVEGKPPKKPRKPKTPKAPVEPKKPKEPVLEKPLTESEDKAYNMLLGRAKHLLNKYNPVKRLKAKNDTTQAAKALAGGDRTKGSCASVALAYVARRNGLDVLDFKGGDSLDYFSSSYNLWLLAKAKGVKTIEAEGASSLTIGNRLLKECKEGKEYYLSVGRHAAIVRNLGEIKYIDDKGKKRKRNHYQYLELQSQNHSGWQDFDEKPRDTLVDRFGCNSKQSGRLDFMIDIDDSDFNNDEFKSLLGYINTKEDEQNKGVGGTTK